VLNREYILEAIRLYLTKDKKLRESDFNRLFSDLTRKKQYQIIEILIDEDIDYVDDEASPPIDQKNIIDIFTEIESESIVETKKSHTAPKSMLGRDAKQLLGLKNEQLCALYQQGDPLALEALVLKNEKFVYRDALALSKQFKQDSLTIDDIVQYGNIGLIAAADRFDVTRGFSFLTYAGHWIKQSITRNIIDHAYLIRLPVHVMERVRRFWGVRAAHPNFTEAELIEEIITSGYATSAKEIRHLLNLGDLYLNTTSLNILIGEDEETELEEFIPSDSSVEDVVEQTFLRESLENVLSTLTPREEKILRLRFGFDDGIERTLEDVGKMFNVTRERIRQIENKALRKLRHPSRTKHIRDFYGLETKRNSSENQPRTTQQAPAPERQSKEPFDYFSDREFDTEIQDVLDHLTAKESTIFSLRFGIDYGHCLTPEEMEVLYGVTKTELHSVETKALLQMDSSFREKFKAAFYGRSTPK
jgi:RNA polymerase primary sigma factor